MNKVFGIITIFVSLGLGLVVSCKKPKTEQSTTTVTYQEPLTEEQQKEVNAYYSLFERDYIRENNIFEKNVPLEKKLEFYDEAEKEVRSEK